MSDRETERRIPTPEEEIRVMADVYECLYTLETEQRNRIMTWVLNRIEQEHMQPHANGDEVRFFSCTGKTMKRSSTGVGTHTNDSRVDVFRYSDYNRKEA